MRNPFKGVADRITENNRLMEQWMAGYATGREQPRGQSEAWAPATDIFIREDRDLVIVAELPGVRQEDIDLSISDGDLTICGEKDGHEEDAEYYAAERYSGFFRRTISLPDGLTEDRISTTFKECMLEIVIHDYAEVLEEKRLEISSGEG